MSAYNIDVIPVVRIGKCGEKLVTEVSFDFSKWKEKYGEGNLVLLLQRPFERLIYPVELQIEDTIATWVVTATDTEIKGIGKATLQYNVDDKIKKSKLFKFIVEESLVADSVAPAPYQDYVNQAIDAVEEAKEYAQSASDSAAIAQMYGQRISFENGIIHIGGTTI